MHASRPLEGNCISAQSVNSSWSVPLASGKIPILYPVLMAKSKHSILSRRYPELSKVLESK